MESQPPLLRALLIAGLLALAALLFHRRDFA